MLFGGYETAPVSRWEDGVPWDHAARSLPPDYERFAPHHGRGDPALPVPRGRRSHPTRLPPRRDDSRCEPAAWPAPGSPRVLGRCRPVAQRVRRRWRDRAGHRRLDHHRRPGCRRRPVPCVAVRARLSRARLLGRVWRARRTRTTTASATPMTPTSLVAPGASRPSMADCRRRVRSSDRRPGGNARTTTSPAGAWRRAGRDQHAWGWAKPPWFERVGDEARAVRERVGIIDLSSFGKIEVDGPGALGLLQRVAANDVDRPVGSIVYSPFLDERAGFVADVTIMRLAADRFRVVTGAGFVASDLAWLETHVLDDARQPPRCQRRHRDDRSVGPCEPVTILAATTDDDVSDVALPLRRAGLVQVAGASRAGSPDQLRRRTRLGAERAVRVGRRRVGCRAAPPVATMVWNRSATEPSIRCGWRRATDTSERT